jgi:predicted mannosyl-3-phosphoglycerate phosphatase (HAD superfamily)
MTNLEKHLGETGRVRIYKIFSGNNKSLVYAMFENGSAVYSTDSYHNIYIKKVCINLYILNYLVNNISKRKLLSVVRESVKIKMFDKKVENDIYKVIKSFDELHKR